jgi:hypothetical protein|tara:strand:+ start:2279 stop:2530 length:252 start_codon:yes stop_codon:yes gene_type:complete
MRYSAIIRDFKSGVIDKDKWTLQLTDDGGAWRYVGDDAYDLEIEEVEQMERLMTAMYGKTEGAEDAVDILVAARVRAEWAKWG